MDDLAHPYIPNAARPVQAAMARTIGIETVEELYAAIPGDLRLARPLDLPAPIVAEYQLRRHLAEALADVQPVGAGRSFLGAGCYQHFVPEICTEIAHRAEFLTAYAGEPYEDHGRWQALFEYASLMADLVEMDVVTVPTYDGHQAAATALRMALRLTGRKAVLLPQTLGRSQLARIAAYLEDAAEVRLVAADPASGQLSRAALAAALDDDVAGILIASPNALGIIETAGPALAQLAHERGAVVVASTDPLVLGYLPSPASWGADIVCGDIQSLGLGLHYGGAHGGFIAVHDEPEFVFELPSRLFGLAPTTTPGELGFVDLAYERTSLARREEGVEWVGTAAALGGVTAAVYLSLLGPDGLSEVAQYIAGLTAYAIGRLSELEQVSVPFADRPHWREFAVRYPIPAGEVNRRLRQAGIVGGAGSDQVPLLEGNTSLICVTETHSEADVDALVSELAAVIK